MTIRNASPGDHLGRSNFSANFLSKRMLACPNRFTKGSQGCARRHGDPEARKRQGGLALVIASGGT